MLPSLEMLVRIFDHHNGCIDHGADRDSDPAQRHDIGIHPLETHHDERRQHAQGKGYDRDQR